MLSFEIFMPRVSTTECARQRHTWGDGVAYTARWNEVPGRAPGPDYWEDGYHHNGWGSVFILNTYLTWMETLGFRWAAEE